MHACMHTYLHAGNREEEVMADEVQYCRCGLVNVGGKPHSGLCKPVTTTHTRTDGEGRRTAETSGAWDGIISRTDGMDRRIALLGQARISRGALT